MEHSCPWIFTDYNHERQTQTLREAIPQCPLWTGFYLEMSNICGKVFRLTLSQTLLQGSQDVRDRMIHRSTSQGSINSPVYSRHSYTPTTSRSPQHFHRPGKNTLPGVWYILNVFLCEFLFTPLVENKQTKKPWLQYFYPSWRTKWKLVPIFILYFVFEKSIILSVCSLWVIKWHFDNKGYL